MRKEAQRDGIAQGLTFGTKIQVSWISGSLLSTRRNICSGYYYMYMLVANWLKEKEGLDVFWLDQIQDCFLCPGEN